MREARDDTRHRNQEAEANHFAAALLAPAYKIRPCLESDPDLRSVQRTSDALDLSLEATIRRYLDLVDMPVAAVWRKDSKVRTAKRRRDFPWITRGWGDALSDLTQASRAIRNGRSGITGMVDSPSAAWTDRDGVETYEQTRIGRDGYAVTLPWAELSMTPMRTPPAGSVMRERAGDQARGCVASHGTKSFRDGPFAHGVIRLNWRS